MMRITRYVDGKPGDGYLLTTSDRALFAADHAEMLAEAGVDDLLAYPTALDRWTTDVRTFGGDYTLLNRATLAERHARAAARETEIDLRGDQ